MLEVTKLEGLVEAYKDFVDLIIEETNNKYVDHKYDVEDFLIIHVQSIRTYLTDADFKIIETFALKFYNEEKVTSLMKELYELEEA